jgi:thiol-disulfide isomerase/thioredoxin
MVLIRCCIGILHVFASCCFPQTIISGRFVGLGVSDLDSASVLIREGTGHTTYARASASKDGSFYLKTDHVGTLMAEFTCPHFKTLQAALICDKPTRVMVDVTLRGNSDADDKSKLSFHDSLSLLAKYALLHLKSTRRWARNAEGIVRLRAEGRPGEDAAIDWSDDTRGIEKALANENEPLLRQELIIQYDELKAIGASSASEDSLKKWILEIPPTSLAWVYHFNLAYTFSIVYRQDPLQYINEIVARHPNPHFARYLYESARFSLGLRDSNQSYTNWSSEARPLLPMFRVGDPVPHFALRSIDDSQNILTNESMSGRIYLIDFWATWCSPCVAEMPNLHEAFERFKDQGFTIISVSEDDSASTVLTYRHKAWPMPWENALASNELHGSIKWSFGAWSIPFPVLVGPQGTILALGDDLKGENLQRALEKFIGR